MVGRFFGWLVLGLAFLAASADAVLALGASGHDGLATGEILTLLAGQNPLATQTSPGILPGAMTSWLLQLPAWTVMGGLGITLLLLFRPRARKALFTTAARRRHRDRHWA